MGLLKLFNKLNTKNEESQLSFIPKDIIDLLWFKDGPNKNYTEKSKSQKINIGGVVFSITTSYSTEPSLISTTEKIVKPSTSDIEPPGYYPSYERLTPNQRYIYLDWLKNIDNEIDISYVFIFYYGLERHLFTSDFIKAWDTINRLRKHHKNNSFTQYSINALIASCIVHNRPDLFIQLLQNTDYIDDLVVSDLYLLAKHKLGGEITPKEIMKIASKVGFKNNRYLKNDALIFENELINIMIERFNKPGIELSNIDLYKCPLESVAIMANYSMDNNQRIVNLPSIIDNEEFKSLVNELLIQAHENTKSKIKEIRKNGGYVPVVNNNIKPKVKKKAEKIYDKSVLFEAIDTSIFDENEGYYLNYICPNCNEKIEKMPVTKCKCSYCKKDILIKNSIFTGEKIAITADENIKMNNIKNERVRRNFITNNITNHQLDIYKIKKEVDTKGIIIEEVLIKEIEQIALDNKIANELGIYRCNLLDIGKIYERIGKLEKALELYLLVCFYDLNGASNSYVRFNREDIFLAPAIIEWINKISKLLKLSQEDIEARYRLITGKYTEEDMFMKESIALTCIKKALYEGVNIRGSYSEVLEQIIETTNV
ncbi:TerB N-terminal domain-containing protein [Romboutsia sp.]|uniref:TerB N-terminal domain-containing protein n=1 Tax=Romboutsia sp. TaxID=1965302 RepID=UPI003F3DBE39